jgi:hypothetical protein
MTTAFYYTRLVPAAAVALSSSVCVEIEENSLVFFLQEKKAAKK